MEIVGWRALWINNKSITLKATVKKRQISYIKEYTEVINLKKEFKTKFLKPSLIIPIICKAIIKLKNIIKIIKKNISFSKFIISLREYYI